VAAEAWRRDADAATWARDHAVGWTHDPGRWGCGAQADRHRWGSGRQPAEPRRLRCALAGTTPRGIANNGASSPVLTHGQAEAIARLLDELAGVYRAGSFGILAGALSQMIDSQLGAPK
jgi:hypothetical protein